MSNLIDRLWWWSRTFKRRCPLPGDLLYHFQRDSVLLVEGFHHGHIVGRELPSELLHHLRLENVPDARAAAAAMVPRKTLDLAGAWPTQ